MPSAPTLSGQQQPSVGNTGKHFSVQNEGSGGPLFEFEGGNLPANVISLKAIVKQYLALGNSKTVPADKLYNILGRLRCLQYLLDEYNERAAKQQEGVEDVYFKSYLLPKTINQISGFQIPQGGQAIKVDGLPELISKLEEMFKGEIESARSLIRSGNITFEGLAELFLPHVEVRGRTSLSGSPAGFRISEAYFEERKTILGSERSFHLALEYVASLGQHFTVIRFDEVINSWMGVRTRPISEFTYSPADAETLKLFEKRGIAFSQYGLGEAKFLQYAPNTFYIHSTAKAGNLGSMSKSSGSLLGSGGRMVIDTARGAALGHHASQGYDEPMNAMMQVSARYRRLLAEIKSSTGAKSVSSDSLILLSEIPKELIRFCWPALVAFSFSAKAWGHVLVDGVSDIKFNNAAFDQLVLDPERKRLIRALVSFGSADEFEDIIGGKSGGSIFLLHGPPGVGKTLTAEAIAEVLHRPLYYVTMGELGTTPDDLERRLSDVLDLCASWDALALIDEADVFLEKRSVADVTRNAMVCVMLRLLEYHNGILFLTTNRIQEFDPAFESRVTVALKYEHLQPSARKQVWKNLIEKCKAKVSDDIDYESLSQNVMNGRQIKNSVRLALALARDSNSPLNQATLLKTIAITALGRDEMRRATNF